MYRLFKIGIIAFAIFLALISHYVFPGWVSIIPWAILALILGYLSLTWKLAIKNGAFYGYFLFITYILIGYNGNMDRAGITRIILFSVFFSLIGALAGISGALMGFFIRQQWGKYSKKSIAGAMNKNEHFGANDHYTQFSSGRKPIINEQ